MASTPNHSMRFILLFGMVSFFADMTYEGARSINGAYLAILGASGAAVGFVAGFGELIGYSFRLFSGYLVDRSKKYWPITFIGYAFNLFAVPLIALTQTWPFAAVLMITERLGKGTRIPSRDTMLSYAAKNVGTGWGFGLHEAMDRGGAMLGALLITVLVAGGMALNHSFGWLVIPAIFAFIVLGITAFLFRSPKDLQPKVEEIQFHGIPSSFWKYLVASAFIAAGYADFALIAYHVQKTSIYTTAMIPLAYAFALGLQAISAPLLGRLYDRLDLRVLAFAILVGTLFAPCVFLGGSFLVGLGVLLWAFGVGAQESLMRPIVAEMVGPEKRASAYGIYYLVYGLSWFFGSLTMGFLYDYSLPLLVAFAVASQLFAFIWLMTRCRTLVRN